MLDNVSTAPLPLHLYFSAFVTQKCFHRFDFEFLRATCIFLQFCRNAFIHFDFEFFHVNEIFLFSESMLDNTE